MTITDHISFQKNKKAKTIFLIFSNNKGSEVNGKHGSI